MYVYMYTYVCNVCIQIYDYIIIKIFLTKRHQSGDKESDLCLQ